MWQVSVRYVVSKGCHLLLRGIKERLRKRVERIPAPAVTLLRLQHLRLAAYPICNKPNVHIVSRLPLVDVRKKVEPNILNFHPALLGYLAPCTRFKTFAMLQVAARACVLAVTMRIFTLMQKHRISAYHHHPNTNERLFYI